MSKSYQTNKMTEFYTNVGTFQGRPKVMTLFTIRTDLFDVLNGLMIATHPRFHLYKDMLPAEYIPLTLQPTETLKYKLGLTIDSVPTVYELSVNEQQRTLVYKMIKAFTAEWVDFIIDQFAIPKLQSRRGNYILLRIMELIQISNMQLIYAICMLLLVLL